MRILIPGQIYVGANSTLTYTQLTAAGTDSAAKSRMQTVINNCGSEDNCATYANVPLMGFKFKQSAYKDTWRVFDPRGFCVTLPNHLLDLLLDEVTLVRGVIQEPCVYGRVSGHNMLLGVNTDLYKRAVIMTQVAESKASWKQVSLGDQITLKTGRQGVYLGKYHVLGKQITRARDASISDLVTENTLEVWHKPMHVIQESGGSGHSTLLLLQNPPLAQFKSDQVLTEVQAERWANDLLLDTKCHVHHNQGYGRMPLVLSTSPSVTHSLTLKPVAVTAQDVMTHIQTHVGKNHYSMPGVCKLNTGEWVHVYNLRSWQCYVFSNDHIAQGERRYLMQISDRYCSQKVMNIRSNQIQEIHEMRVQHTSKLGNHYDVIIE